MYYSIKDIEHLTGIKAHTIRIWEKRYKILNPERKPTRIRCYNDNDLKRILNISTLNHTGIKISKIAGKTDDQLAEMVNSIKLIKRESFLKINDMIKAMIDLDESAFIKIINDDTLLNGFENTVTELIYPFLEKIGVLWQTGNILPAHEHFVSNLIRQKLIVAIDALSLNPNQLRGKMVMFLPEGEFHEFGLLFYYYIARKNNYHVFYLGQSTPYADVLQVAEMVKPDKLLTAFISSYNGINVTAYLNQLSTDFNNLPIGVSGYFTNSKLEKNYPNITILRSLNDVRQFLV